MPHLAMRDRIPLWEAASPGTRPVPLAVELLGFVAAALTSLCWLPQTWRTLRTRDTRAISLWTQLLLACGTVLWLVYGVQILSWPVIVANSLTLLLVLAIITMKLRFG
ncbi:SemiSWEET family sugar transporter [uncultured Bosea sp.]|uniref:SemiSWEET family sugar transporter n=1 Tax=uncultured Bosea sp. TaxID=211457 RepID=UPI0025DE4159|nr:SemiSWEET transporter [uncultured Bosea sp.]